MKRALAGLATLVLGTSVATAQEVVEYYHLDAIGNVRAVSNQANVVIERHDYLPFGEECTTGPCASNPGVGAGQPRKFTSKERDQETGLDYFGARYYGNRIARFTTIDPVYTWADNLADPQKWNRYAYGRNNPLRYLDPDGRVERTPVDARLIAEARARSGYVDQGTCSALLDTALPAVGIAVTVGPLVVLAAEAAPALVTAAAIKAADPKTQSTVHDMLEGLTPGPSGPRSETLSRFGTSYESAARLGRKAAEAEAKMGIHGVSSSAGPSSGGVSTAARASVEQHFRVHDTPTRADPFHRTIELSKPVTREIANLFNDVFGRSR